MADVTELKSWPACLQAIDWSPDGIIALASDEQVELLFPSTEPLDSDRNISQWRHFPLQIPWFTVEELPVKTPAPQSIYSIGEEISSSFTFGLAWSPPGLAKHRRSALAALTANLVLSLWASDGKPQEEGSWGRRLIINDSIEEYVANSATGNDGTNSLVTEPAERLRLRSRVRTFAWAPLIPSGSTIGTHERWGLHLISVATDDNQVLLMSINSPATTLGLDTAWSADVMCSFSVAPGTTHKANGDLSTFEDLIDEQRYAPHLAWSPWIQTGRTSQSIFAYATNWDVRVRIVTYLDGDLILGEEIVFPDIETKYAGLLKWTPWKDNNKTLSLACFTTTEVVCLSFSVVDGAFVSRSSFKRDGQWDTLSGAVWDVFSHDNPRLHFATQTMTLRSPVSVLELSPDGLKPLDEDSEPHWRKRLASSVSQHSTRFDLKGNSVAKVAGLCISPLGDSIASCHTVHPTDMIEYGTPHDRRTTITISQFGDKNAPLTFQKQPASAEAILYTVRRWIEQNLKSHTLLPKTKDEILEKLLKVYHAPLLTTTTPSEPTTDKDISTLKRTLMITPPTIHDRLEILTTTILTPSPSPSNPTLLPRATIAYRLALALHSPSPPSSSASPLTTTLLASTKAALHLLTTATASPTFSETCTFCASKIPFDDLATATCEARHAFQRCGVSFLSIQAPGAAKYCWDWGGWEEGEWGTYAAGAGGVEDVGPGFHAGGGFVSFVS
ncbi:hypothetical protein BU24DRAFT_443548 [Aaosphaeria arxii CBS 175.79]|uniref:Transcription factor IIIC 90kDa subunit N-terminal domain-containing protein n=1 Tax=Aaosphaeria arxii CBS 175.79 TaxID=1450172 RepID=A0A6A5XHE6_9PLEO|nr:uncharacterized protein BU24DRAFT_443548 [Aaosphaeria arxii CBS 175.79]KAF2012277.1 hypothetical protein BU24DRAFT_443548 [Aaosphaeria arxii CBS 175.79]